jgi:hypothetical protein
MARMLAAGTNVWPASQLPPVSGVWAFGCAVNWTCAGAPANCRPWDCRPRDCRPEGLANAARGQEICPGNSPGRLPRFYPNTGTGTLRSNEVSENGTLAEFPD